MSDNQDKINQLILDKMEMLFERQGEFIKEINTLKGELRKLKNETPTGEGKTETGEKAEIENPESKIPPARTNIDSPAVVPPQKQEPPEEKPLPKVQKQTPPKPPKIKVDFEKFIGENLINKVGIAITIIGVAIGAKYSIDNDLISPLTRIVLGYVAGIGLLIVGIKLKQKYESYSAVLVSGAMAIMYFITFSAYSFYFLFPQTVAFGLMVIFTAFTVFAAISYNRQVIAHIGLVGAYAVPFLLSEGSGQVVVLFTYMAIINVGILVIAVKKYWKSLYYASFALTWLMYFVWYGLSYHTDLHIHTGLIFLAIFFTTFYATFMVYKLVKRESFDITDVILLLINAFIFYATGFAIMSNEPQTEPFLGLFTLGNAIIHFGVTAIIYKQKKTDKNLFYLIAGLVLVFITITIPVQLDGNWVTLLWAGEAALLFWMGRTKGVAVYEKISYLLMVLAFGSILHDWSIVYDNYDPDFPETRLTPILNVNFLTSVLFVGAFGFISYLNQKTRADSTVNLNRQPFSAISFILPAIFIFTLYNAFRLEIANYWGQLFLDSRVNVPDTINGYASEVMNYDLVNFRTVWVLNYTLLFVATLSFLNMKKVKNRRLGMVNLVLNALVIGMFLYQGLYALSELRLSYLQQEYAEYYHIGVFNVVIRYISFLFVGTVLIATYQYSKQAFIKYDLRVGFDFLLHFSILSIASSELINWMAIFEAAYTDKLGLSILWGFYALVLIGLGISKNKKHLRIGAIVLFGITLIKLFFYDISQLDTISKTIVFVALGLLLLVISFLYNKYKHLIVDENKA